MHTATLENPLSRSRPQSRPRLGFLGVGWIGRNRMEALAHSGLVEICAIADPNQELTQKAHQVSPDAELLSSFDELLQHDLDGIVIATPSALHAEQSIRALDAGLAVFCQKPLGRSAAETRRVVEVAQHRNLLLGVDLSYRHIKAFEAAHALCQSGDLGRIYAVDLTFHNAYGPDKPWFYDPRLSGGGCVIDLGIHLIDQALWNLQSTKAQHVSSRLYSQGRPLQKQQNSVEDYAVATFDLNDSITVRMACSWKLPAGCDAVIEAAFYGTNGAVRVRNVDGSFYDFTAERSTGTQREVIASGSDDWGGKAALDWAHKLSEGAVFDSAGGQELINVAEVLDTIYDRHCSGGEPRQ